LSATFGIRPRARPSYRPLSTADASVASAGVMTHQEPIAIDVSGAHGAS
jgi:hypothetical protein